MNSFISSVVASILAGIGGTGLGAVIALSIENIYWRKRNKSIDDFIKLFMGFSGGVMIVVICFDLVPSSYDYAGLATCITSVILGCVTIPLLEMIIDSLRNPQRNRNYPNKSNLYRNTSILVFVSIALHNLPEGLAVGSGFSAQAGFGISLAIVIMLHNIPEGIALAVPMITVVRNRMKILFYSLVAGVPTLMGAVIGWALAEISEIFIGACLGFAGGAMLYVVIGQLFPISYVGKHPRRNIFMIILGFMLGLFIINIL